VIHTEYQPPTPSLPLTGIERYLGEGFGLAQDMKMGV